MKNKVNKCVLLIVQVIAVIGCTTQVNVNKTVKVQSASEKLVEYCKKHNQQLSIYNYVFVINEIGTCINCNNIFAKKQGENLKRDSILFIVSGIGNKVDFSTYINNNSSNIIHDNFAGFDTLDIVRSCAIITLDSNKQIIKIEEVNFKTVGELSVRGK